MAIEHTMGLFQEVVGLKKIQWVSFRGLWGNKRYQWVSFRGWGAIKDTMRLPMREGGGGIIEGSGVGIGVRGYHKIQ